MIFAKEDCKRALVAIEMLLRGQIGATMSAGERHGPLARLQQLKEVCWCVKVKVLSWAA